MPGDEEPEWSAFLEVTLLAVLEAADEGIVVFDSEGRCRMIGRRIGELFGVDPQAYVGRARMDVLRAMSEACEEPEAFLDAVAKNDLTEPPITVGDIDVRKPRPRTLVWTSFPILRDGVAAGRVGLVRDATRERSAERAQKQLATRLGEVMPHDALTGVFNLRRFREELEREHGRSTRAWDSYAVLRLDVDGMQSINDTYGTPVGDEVLETIADVLRTCRREYDVLARVEGDEFAVLLPGADAVGAQAVAERVAKAIAMYHFKLTSHPRITLSIGGCVWVPPSPVAAQEIFDRAGGALKKAVGEGEGTIRVDTVSMPTRPPPPVV